ncbi:MAG: S-methyl-5'-thioadenosine phosphorylase [Candidatus Promineifilaceae bacterium]
MQNIEIAVIGGSGLYGMEGLENVEELRPTSPFGDPSDTVTVGSLHGTRVAFLPRHGRGHFLMPSEVPYRANIFVLKQLGVRYIVSVSACGSLREEYAPGHIVIPDQLVDFTKGKRDMTFFGNGLVAHVGIPDPFSPELSGALATAITDAGGITHEGANYITVEGPRFSTKGESQMFRRWGMDLVGMTTSPEAFLAAEAEIAYTCMARVTDYDVWHETEEAVTAEKVMQTSAENLKVAQKAISNLVRAKKNWAGSFSAHNAMEGALALISDWSKVSADLREELSPLVGKYITEMS